MADLYDVYAQGSKGVSTNGFANSLIANAAGQSIFYGCDGYNNSATPKFLMVFDSATVPANGTFPIANKPLRHIFPMPANSTFSAGAAFAAGEGIYINGLVAVVSTTAASLTIDTAGTSFISIQYETMP